MPFLASFPILPEHEPNTGKCSGMKDRGSLGDKIATSCGPHPASECAFCIGVLCLKCDLVTHQQEILKLMPESCEHLALCSKAWSDATYLDEIHNKFKEPLSNQMKKEVNMKARDLAVKVGSYLHLNHAFSAALLQAQGFHESSLLAIC